MRRTTDARPKRRRRILAAMTAVVVLGAALVFGPSLWAWFESRGHLFQASEAPKEPVALILGAGVLPSGDPSPFLRDRLEVAQGLYEDGTVDALLVSGDNRYANYDEPTAMANWLIEQGVPADAIVRDFAGRDTYDSCVRAKRIFGVESAIVVSQTYHLRRAVALCRAVGIDAQGVGSSSGASYAPGVYQSGELREIPATVKAALDLATNRQPVLGDRETSLDTAVANAASIRAGASAP